MSKQQFSDYREEEVLKEYANNKKLANEMLEYMELTPNKNNNGKVHINNQSCKIITTISGKHG